MKQIKNVALYYFSGMNVSHLIQNNQSQSFHFFDPYPSNSDWENCIRSKSRIIWAPLEQYSHQSAPQLLSMLLPYIDNHEIDNIINLYYRLSPCINDMGQVIYMAQRTLMGQLPTSHIVSYCHKLSRLWQACLQYFQIDLFIGTILPHSLTDYLCLDACVSQSIPTVCPTATALSTSCQYYDFTNKYFIKLHSYHDLHDSQLKNDIKEFVDANCISNSHDNLGYTKIFREISNKRSLDYKKFLLSGSSTPSEILKYKCNLAETYDKLAKDKTINLDVKRPSEIHALFLQYQPESSTCPQGNIYYDQLLAVEKILDEIDDDGIILVKEHPNQFFRCGISDSTTNEHLKNILSFRMANDYEVLNSIRQCYLYPRHLSASSLLDLPLAKVWNIGGTVSLQAVLRGIPLGNLDIVSPYHELNQLAFIDSASERFTSVISRLSQFTFPRFRRDSEVLLHSEDLSRLVEYFVEYYE